MFVLQGDGLLCFSLVFQGVAKRKPEVWFSNFPSFLLKKDVFFQTGPLKKRIFQGLFTLSTTVNDRISENLRFFLSFFRLEKSFHYPCHQQFSGQCPSSILFYGKQTQNFRAAIKKTGIFLIVSPKQGLEKKNIGRKRLAGLFRVQATLALLRLSHIDYGWKTENLRLFLKKMAKKGESKNNESKINDLHLKIFPKKWGQGPNQQENRLLKGEMK